MNMRLSFGSLMTILLATAGLLLAVQRPAYSLIDTSHQVTSISITVYVGMTPAPTTPPSSGADGNAQVDVTVGAVASQFTQPSTRSLVFSGNAGQTVTESCAEELWFADDTFEYDGAVATAFTELNGSETIPATALEWEFGAYNVKLNTPEPTYTPFVNYATDGNEYALIGTGIGPGTACLNLQINIPATASTGVYVANLSFAFYTAGTTGSIPPTASPSPTPTPGYIYSAPFVGSQNYLYAYALGSNGNVAPVSTITSTNTLANPMDVTTAPNGDVIIANEAYEDLLVLAPDPLGAVTPVATITNSLFSWPSSVGTDSAGNIYVLQGDANNWATAAIMKFPSSANGTVNATSEIPTSMGVATTSGILDAPRDIAITSNGTIYTTSFYSNGTNDVGELLAFPTTANGSTATPSATITGSSTDLGENVCSVAVDGQSNIYAYARDDNSGCPFDNTVVPNPTNPRIVVFSSGSNGNVAPTAVIAGSNTMITDPIKIRVDASGDIYVADLAVGGILYFAAGANGNVAPTAIISGSNTGLGVDNIQFVGL
jgi:hypothetical protein